MPSEVLAIIDVIGPVRTEILRDLALGPQSTIDLTARLGVAHSTVHRQLVKLEELGLVEADTEPGRRAGRGRNVLWRTVSERVEEVGRQWIAYASGQLEADETARPVRG